MGTQIDLVAAGSFAGHHSRRAHGHAGTGSEHTSDRSGSRAGNAAVYSVPGQQRTGQLDRCRLQRPTLGIAVACLHKYIAGIPMRTKRGNTGRAIRRSQGAAWRGPAGYAAKARIAGTATVAGPGLDDSATLNDHCCRDRTSLRAISQPVKIDRTGATTGAPPAAIATSTAVARSVKAFAIEMYGSVTAPASILPGSADPASAAT